jgi:aryl-alcohol dehydrogenase-like predicted oxidoreductase/histidinol phosphatase-like enzyme/predicted kinase
MIGLGCMRLSTLPDRDEARAVAVLHAALDAGVRLLDTADAYALDATEAGHNERLICRALASWAGDARAVTVATKGGLTRPGGAWVANGKPGHLKRAARESAVALNVGSIDLYQLHAVDPRTPFATSLRALVALLEDGTVTRVGLCNVSLAQLKVARTMLPVASVQVSVSPFELANLRNGVVDYALDEGLRVLAYRPLGGDRARELPAIPVLSRWGARLGVTPAELVLAWLAAKGLVPLPGATRVATATSLGVATTLQIPDEAAVALDAEFRWPLRRPPRSAPAHARTAAPGEVVMILGIPGAGKSTYARELESRGYRRLNRDAEGGTLQQLAARLRDEGELGQRFWVLDNTYATRASRRDVLDHAAHLGLPVRCIWRRTTLADAQVNAIHRLIEAHGSLPSPEVIRQRQRHDPRYLGPDALFRFERQFEPPELDEGFAAIEERAFTRAESHASRPAVFLELDRCLDEGVPIRPDDVRLNARVVDRVRALAGEGWAVLVHAWRPHVASGSCTASDVEAMSHAVQRHVGAAVGFAWCPHPAGPPICWCRKPIPGLHLAFAVPNGIALGGSLVVGPSVADRTVANRLGARYLTPESFAGAE